MRLTTSIVLILIGLNLLSSTSAWARKKHTYHRYRIQEIVTLSEISTYLYGTKKHWRAIAKLNRIRKPYPVWEGRILKLPFPPTLTHEQGLEEIVQMRARRYNQPPELSPSDRTLPPTPSPEPALSPSPERAITPETIAHQQAVQQAFEEELQKDPDPIILGEEETNSAPVLISRDQESPETSQNPSKIPLKTEDELFKEAEAAFQNKDFTNASSIFKDIRTARPAAFKSWIFEIRCHLAAEDKTKARETAQLFVKELPEYEQIPLIQKALAD